MVSFSLLFPTLFFDAGIRIRLESAVLRSLFLKAAPVLKVTVYLFVGLAVAWGPVARTSNAADRPNVVVIMGDDWSWPHASILGDQVVKTPVFDRIAREGVLFENAFVSSPSCTPSRFAIATGQHCWRLGDGSRLGGSLAKDVPVYADLLADAGYQTGFCRKGAAPSKHVHRGNDPFGAKFKDFDEFMDGRTAGESFCFWYGAGEPHRPYDYQASKNSNMDLSKIKVPACLPDNDTVRTDIGDYYLRVQKLDKLAGRIVSRLETEGELENTIVIMAGDNGMPFPRCKATLYDLGTRVPLALRWGSNVGGGAKVKDFVSLCDLAPTILEAAKITPPSTMTGQSLVPQILAKNSGMIDQSRDHVLVGREQHVYARPSRAIRDSGFLYIRNFSAASWPSGEVGEQNPVYDFGETPWPTKPPAFSFDIDPSPTKQWMRLNPAFQKDQLSKLTFGQRDEEELYDLSNDPDQLNSVVDLREYQDVRQKLSDQLTSELRESGDPRFNRVQHATLQIHGWTVHLHDRLWQDSATKTKAALEIMALQLQRVIDVVPKPALKKLQQVPIWMNPPYEGVRPTAEYHPGARWLKNNGRDPVMVKSVEVTTVAKLVFENTRMPYFMLHELAHAYHDQVLAFNHPSVTAAFEQARDSGDYDSVQRFTGRKMTKDKAYAMSSPQEYFAESTEAYFGKNDFFPFNNAELKKHDPAMYELVEQLWKVKK